LDPRAVRAAASRSPAGKGGKAGPPQGGPKIKTIDNSRFAAAPPHEGGSAMDALMNEIGGLGDPTAGLKKAKKGTAKERKKIDSRKKSEVTKKSRLYSHHPRATKARTCTKCPT